MSDLEAEYIKNVLLLHMVPQGRETRAKQDVPNVIYLMSGCHDNMEFLLILPTVRITSFFQPKHELNEVRTSSECVLKVEDQCTGH